MAATHELRAPAQFEQYKAMYPDVVLFFEMGDFYESFGDDARLVSRTLGVTLIGDSAGDPMTAIPSHALEGSLTRMLVAGHKAAICTPTEKK